MGTARGALSLALHRWHFVGVLIQMVSVYCFEILARPEWHPPEYSPERWVLVSMLAAGALAFYLATVIAFGAVLTSL
jgi:hypothetical protein